jgi:hypothetical protein
MTQICEARDCEDPAEFQADSPEPGGTIHLCRVHYEWTAYPSTPEDGQCDNCGRDLYEVETDLYVNRCGDAFCHECWMAGDK